jgi:hypothetical protein
MVWRRGCHAECPSCQTYHGARRRFSVSGLPRQKFHLSSIVMTALLSVPLLALGVHVTLRGMRCLSNLARSITHAYAYTRTTNSLAAGSVRSNPIIYWGLITDPAQQLRTCTYDTEGKVGTRSPDASYRIRRYFGRTVRLTLRLRRTGGNRS